RRRHTRCLSDWSSDVCSSDLASLPGLLRARMSGNEASAIGSLRAINSAQSTYSSSCAGGGYATDLADLVKAPQNGGQGFISPDRSEERRGGEECGRGTACKLC